MGPRMGADHLHHLRSGNGVVNEQIDLRLGIIYGLRYRCSTRRGSSRWQRTREFNGKVGLYLFQIEIESHGTKILGASREKTRRLQKRLC